MVFKRKIRRTSFYLERCSASPAGPIVPNLIPTEHVIKYEPVYGIPYLVIFHRELDETLDYSQGLGRSRSKQMEKNEESRCRRSEGTDGCGSSRPLTMNSCHERARDSCFRHVAS